MNKLLAGSDDDRLIPGDTHERVPRTGPHDVLGAMSLLVLLGGGLSALAFAIYWLARQVLATARLLTPRKMMEFAWVLVASATGSGGYVVARRTANFVTRNDPRRGGPYDFS